MGKSISGFLGLIGRIALVAIFLMSAVGNKIPNWNQTLNYMVSNGMPGGTLGHFLLFGAVAFLIVGSVSIILGFLPRIGALLLMAFLVPATLIFHDFWADEPAAQRMQQIQFMKNLAIFGGLLLVLAQGVGPWSVPLKRKRKTAGQSSAA